MISTSRPKPILTKTYKSLGQFERDAQSLYKKGYSPTSITSSKGHALWGHTLVKWVTLVGILTGPTRTHDTITVVYMHESTRPATAGPAPSFVR